MFLYLALRELDWNNFISSLRNADYRFVLLALSLGCFTNLIRAARWKLLLVAEKPIPLQNVFWANMTGYMGNNLLPARAGDLIRAAYVSRENHLSFSFTLATGLVERFIDLIALVLLGTTSLSLAQILAQPLQIPLRIMSIIAAVGAAALFLLPYFGRKLFCYLPDLFPLDHPSKEKLAGWLNQFFRGVEALHHPTRITSFILLTSLVWVMDATGILIVAYALHIKLTYVQSFLLLAGLGLSSAIPSTPGYIGVYQFVAVLVLTPFGISSENSIALVIVNQITGFLLILILGGIAVLRTPRVLDTSISH